MRLLKQLGAAITIVGLLLVMVGGINVRGDPDGTWVQVSIVHAAGGITVSCGAVLSFLAAFRSSQAKTGPERGAPAVPAEINR